MFRSRPIYFADPGSLLEQAFRGSLALLDADRPYPKLLRRLGIARLAPGETVVEEFLGEGGLKPAERLCADITKHLAPYLLASILAKSDPADQREIILAVFVNALRSTPADKLTVSYALKDAEIARQTIEFPKFYLQRRIEHGHP